MPVLVQSAQGQSGVATLDAPPADGSLVVVLVVGSTTWAMLDTFVDLTGGDFLDTAALDVGIRMYSRIASGDDGTYGMNGDNHWQIAEFADVDSATPIAVATLERQGPDDHPTISVASTDGGDVLVIGAFIHNNTLDPNFVPDAGWDELEFTMFPSNNKQFGMVYFIGPDEFDYDPGVSTTPFTGGWAAVGAVWSAGGAPPEPPVDPGYTPPAPAKAILELYLHDEDASKWGEATWATGPATGTEGIWSGAGWQDATPYGVRAHVIWGSRRPERGILADQDAASWNVQTYDPDRILDPGNPDSPYYPQLVPGLPIRISHNGLVIRTGYCDIIEFAHRDPENEGRLTASDSIAIMAQATVPDDSILGDTLLERVQDAIVAAGIQIGGLPIGPPALGDPGNPDGPNGPALSDRIPGEVSVWDHVREAARECLWVAGIDNHGGIYLRPWGNPLDRGTELADPLLEDLRAVVSEDGVYSWVRVNDSTGASPIDRVAAPLPRYGRRLYERTQTTEDPEGWADAVLADRSWPGVQYRPGTLHPMTAAEVDMLGSIAIMERVLLTSAHAGLSVAGRVLGGELWVEQRKGPEHGAKWQFRFAVATDGSTALGITTLVSDQAGDTLVDDDAGTDYLEAD